MAVFTVTATFSAPPITPTVALADFPNDKQVGLMLMHDDGSLWDTDIAAMIKSHFYSDGAGVNRQVGYGFAINGNVRDELNSAYTSWAEYASMLAADKNIHLMNHTYSHGSDPSPLAQLELNEVAVRNALGIEMNTIVVPSGLPGFVQAGLDSGNYRLISSQGYSAQEPHADGYNDEVSYVDGVTLTKIIPNRMMITTRHNLDGLLVAGQPDARAWLDTKVADALANNRKSIFAAFTHDPDTQQELDYLEEFIEYALSKNGGNMWMGSPQQFADYIDTKTNAVVSAPVVNGNSISFTVDVSGVHARNRFQDLSLKITGGTLTNVTVSGADSYSANNATGLVNIYKLNGSTPVVPSVKTFRGVRFTKAASLPSERITGQIPVDVPLYLTSLQTPPQPVIHELFDENHANPVDYYGSMFNPVSVYQDFPVGQNPVISYFELGNKNYGGADFLIYGVNNDNTEELLVTHTAAGTYNITDKAYKRLRYVTPNNCRPVYIRVFGTYTPITVPANPTYTKYPLGNHTGVNLHNYNVLEDLTNPNIRNDWYPASLAKAVQLGSIRIYVDNRNIVETEGVYTFDYDRQAYAMDKLFETAKANNIYVCYCMQGGVNWLNTNYPSPDANMERVPVEYNADRLDPTSWDRFIDIAEQITIRYGRNTSLPLSASKSKEGYLYPQDPSAGSWNKKIGLDYVKELEPYNEIDKWWKGAESYASGKEMAVFMNRLYDKVKAIDPTMEITYPGLAAFAPDILQEFVYWSMTLYGKIPVDNYAYHYYPNSAGSQYSGEASTGKAIEISFAPTAMLAFRRSDILRLGNKPFDCGEIGYDSNIGSPLRAVVPAGSSYTQREWAGILYSRVALYHAKNGVRRTFHYQWSDLNASDWDQFAKMGLLVQNGATWDAYPNFNMLAQIRSIAGNYIHSAELSSTPLVDRWLYNGSIIYSLYSATEDNTSVNYDLVLPNGTSIEIIEPSLTSTTPTVTPQTISGGKITITCTEKPKFIKIL